MTEVVDLELDRLISRQASQDRGPTADEREELWKASGRAHHAKIRRRNWAAWFAHFCEMAAAHARMSKDYERRAEALCQEGA